MSKTAKAEENCTGKTMSANAERPNVRAFRDWLFAQAAREGADGDGIES